MVRASGGRRTSLNRGLQALEDTLELLSDPTARDEIETARQELAAGDAVGADELRSKYLQR